MTYLSTSNAEKMSRMISLAMIVKNEEKTIARAIRSVQGCVEEVIVVDTGSADGTVGAAEACGAKVFRHDFTGDFSEARNISIEACRGEWILVLDADEFFPLSPKLMIETATEPLGGGDSYKGFYLMRHNFESNANEVTYSDYVLRLFRNDKRVRYRHRVHETLEEGLDGVEGIYGRLTTMPISHHLFERDAAYLAAKRKNYVDSLLKDISDHPRDAGRYDFLGCEYVRMGRLAEAETVFRKFLDLDPENAGGRESLRMVLEMMEEQKPR